MHQTSRYTVVLFTFLQSFSHFFSLSFQKCNQKFTKLSYFWKHYQFLIFSRWEYDTVSIRSHVFTGSSNELCKGMWHLVPTAILFLTSSQWTKPVTVNFLKQWPQTPARLNIYGCIHSGTTAASKSKWKGFITQPIQWSKTSEYVLVCCSNEPFSKNTLAIAYISYISLNS